jgi:hypothetical protein
MKLLNERRKRMKKKTETKKKLRKWMDLDLPLVTP